MRGVISKVAFSVATLPVRRPSKERPRLIALLSFRDEMRFLPGWFASNAHQVDGVVAYDDGSTDGSAEYVAAQASVLELLHRPAQARDDWNEPEIHERLMEAAARHGADWLVAVDADERLEEEFGHRSRVAISRFERRGVRAATLRLRELWDAPDQYRVDGVWGGKRPVRLFSWRADAVFDQRRVHSTWAPLNSAVFGRFGDSDLTIYHLRMIDPRDRQARRARYEALDPNSREQAIGYAYLTDESGIELEGLPQDRGYRPLHREPEIAVVVISVGNPPELVGAVRSIQEQDVPAEIVVVNTGGGDAAKDIAAMGVRVIETADTRYVGAARNLGVAATRAPVVAFLAADCRAEAGWLRHRLNAHHAGARAVSSALTNSHSRGLASWAAHGLLAINRMPTLSAEQADAYGASYDREVLEEVGPFREDLRTGEDTEYHARLEGHSSIEWCPNVRTAHLNATSVRSLLTDQYERGRRLRAEWWHLAGSRPWKLPLRVFVGLPGRTVRAVQRAERGTRSRILMAAPLIILGGLAHCFGTMRPPPRIATPSSAEVLSGGVPDLAEGVDSGASTAALSPPPAVQ